MRLIAAWLFVLGACDDPDCGLEARLDEYVDGATLHECGQLTTRPTDRQPYLDARECVLTAAAAETPFIVRWTSFGIDSGLESALFGIHADGWHLRKIASSWSVKGNIATEGAVTSECRSIGGAGGDCETLFYDLCLACANSTTTATCE